MNILYCGTEIKGNFIQEVSKKDKITYTGAYNRAAEYEDIIFGNQYDVIIFDVTDVIDDSMIIRDYIKRVMTAKNCKVIISASGFSYQSKVIDELISIGIVNFVLAVGLATQYDEYSKCLSGYYESNGIEKEIQEEKKEEEERNSKKIVSKTIGVAGVMARIGTTTICLQIVKYLQQKGYNVVYVEINTNDYIDHVKELYADVTNDREQKYIIYNNIKLYKGSNINDALHEKYDFVICDYGSIDNPSFNKISFSEKGMKVFVAGSKPNEIENIQTVIQSQIYMDAKYVLNFVPDADKKDLLEMMCEKAEDTIFTQYTPDPFDYITNNDFEKLLPVDQNIQETNVEKKSLFTFTKKLRKAR